MKRLNSRLDWKTTSPKPGKKNIKLGKRESGKSRPNRLEQRKPTKKENGESPIAKRNGAKDAITNIMDRVTADPNRIQLAVGITGDRDIRHKIVMLKEWFVTNSRNRGTFEENVRN